jgi:hypothetical protein
MKFIALALVLLSGPFELESQTLMSASEVRELWQQYAQRGDVLISDIRPKFRRVLNSPDSALETNLEYKFVITGNINAFALPDRRTLITSSFLQIIDSMATVMAAAQTFNKPACLGSYIQYLTDGTRENSRLVAHGHDPKAVAMAFGYWQLNPDVCGGLSESAFRSNEKADNLRELMIYASLIYLVGHEFAHHKYQDDEFTEVTPAQRQLHLSQGLDVTREVIPSEQVKKEERADLFAFHKMIEMDYPPLAAMPVLVFFLGIEGYSPEQSATADHPAAFVRFNDMIDTTKGDSSFMDLIRQHNLQQEWNQFVTVGKQLQAGQ